LKKNLADQSLIVYPKNSDVIKLDITYFDYNFWEGEYDNCEIYRYDEFQIINEKFRNILLPIECEGMCVTNDYLYLIAGENCDCIVFGGKVHQMCSISKDA